MHRNLNLQFKIYSNHGESMGDEEWGGELLKKKEKKKTSPYLFLGFVWGDENLLLLFQLLKWDSCLPLQMNTYLPLYYNISQLFLQLCWINNCPKFSSLTQSTFILKLTGLQVAWSSAALVGLNGQLCSQGQKTLASNCVFIFILLLGPGLSGSCSFQGKWQEHRRQARSCKYI